MVEKCGARTIFWPDVECIDVECDLERGHEGDHEDGCLSWPDGF